MAIPPIATGSILTSRSSPQLQPMATSPKSSSLGSHSTVSMPFIKRHVTRRLKAAKHECDKELTSLTNSITAFFEEKLRESEGSREILSENPSTDELDRTSARHPRESMLSASPRLKQFNPESGETSSDEEEYGAEPVNTLRSRQASVSSSPTSLRRQSTFPIDVQRPSHASLQSGFVSAIQSNSPDSASSNPLLPPATSAISRRLSRSINLHHRPTRSNASSRSTSRSRSPMTAGRSSFYASSSISRAGLSDNRRSSRILVDDPIDPFMLVLHSIIALCTDIIDMPLSALTSSPDTCAELVQRVQAIGQTWDEHSDWHGRAWYVQLLLSVAGLSRVVEWWEAEKQFWNLDDETDDPTHGVVDDGSEPLIFVVKSIDKDGVASQSDYISNQLESRSPSFLPDRRSRDEQQKPLDTRDSTPSSEIHESDQSSDTDAARGDPQQESAKLREEVDRAQNTNIVMELSLDGEQLIWVNDAWRVVVGLEPEDMTDVSIDSLLSPANIGMFRDATQRLQQDDSSTIAVDFKLQVQDEGTEPAFRRMVGQGMLMLDRLEGRPTHSMWVIKPTSEPEPESPHSSRELAGFGLPAFNRRAADSPINYNEVLCRICDCPIPQWFFEKHSETCHEAHKLEADVGECNDSIVELRNTIRELSATIDKGSTTQLEYRGTPILSPTATSPKGGPLQIFRPQLAGKLQRMGIKKLQKRLLEQLDEILQVAAEISIPSLKEEESKEPIERQRLLSPSSERKISTIKTWNKPHPEDPALAKLVSDVDTLMKAKLDSVVRMQNTVRYAEKVRQEWEQRVQKIVSNSEKSEVGEDEGNLNRNAGDHSSATSEYAFQGDTTEGVVTANLTPIAPSPVSRSHTERVSSHLSLGPRWYQGRSPTPSTTSSPLASSQPITAESPEAAPLLPPPAIENPRVSSDEPRLIVTPPITPGVSDGDNLHRRTSSAAYFRPRGGSIVNPIPPRITSVPPTTRATPSSIRDFEIIKPISKGAFGSVFLAKKKLTGEYYAIKVLKKSDMIAKNQITNVKAERMILMKQGESPFVVKLYWTFQSRENLYLVMEYLNGGDCAALIKAIGCLPEEWTRNYVAEVILGLEHLHQRGVTHRDLKPDNLLIDQHGHLKLTDFGLSRIGLLGRQTRDGNASPMGRHTSRPPSLDSVYLTTPATTPDAQLSSYFGLRAPTANTTPSVTPVALADEVDSSSSEGLSGAFLFKRATKATESPLQSFASELATDLRLHVATGSRSPHKVVGTPDYLAPETILGISKDDRMVDWWALGVITYEFLYGCPPFHADTPDQVFDNILSGRIEWHEDSIDFSEEARDLMERLLQRDPSQRLGAQGADEVKIHPFFRGIEWDKLRTQEAQFIPQVTDPESTDYFDSRGALPQFFQEDEISTSTESNPQATSAPIATFGEKTHASCSGGDDFGGFSFKNLGILKQANDDVIKKLKTEQTSPILIPGNENIHRRQSFSQRFRRPPNVLTGTDQRQPAGPTNPPSPSTSASSIASSPSYSSIGPSTPGSYGSHNRRPSEYTAVERFKLNHGEGDRRGPIPSRLRTASVSSVDPGVISDRWPSPVHLSSHATGFSESPADTSSKRRGSVHSSDRALKVLIAEDNPISAKILETLLTRMGCRCVVVADGSEAVSIANGDVRFDVIMLDLNMPIIDGEAAAQYIKSTSSKNTNTPIISVSAYTGLDSSPAVHLFVASLSKPVQKADLLSVLRNLGFRTKTAKGDLRSSTSKPLPVTPSV